MPHRPGLPRRPGLLSHRHATARPPGGLRALLAGVVLIGAVGSCELPKPKLPSIGSTPAGPSVVTRI